MQVNADLKIHDPFVIELQIIWSDFLALSCMID